MKIQYLAVIFIIIIMPIIIVFSEYLNKQITMVKTEQTYDARLFESTYDSIKAFQLNTINSMYYTPQSRVKNIEAAVNTFFNSLVSSFQYDGNLASVMKEYVPAVVFTLYDGYYIYSPFNNRLTGVKDDDVDNDYKNSKILNGLKPYVSYSCRYGHGTKEYVITYTLDNYIYVDIFDNSTGSHETKSGYLINGIVKNGDTYKYDGVEFKKDHKEKLSEFLGGNLGNKVYYYAVLDGTKYYYEGTNLSGIPSQCDNEKDYIFYIDEQRERHKQVYKREGNEVEFDKYYNKIFNNDSAYRYYKNAHKFTKWVRDNLEGLSTGEIIESDNYSGYNFFEVNNIFEGNIEYSDSNFNRHRADVIRAVITTNLPTAITGFKKYSNSNAEFLMPKISETDWELLENNVCIAAFLQGMKVGDKTYNNYAVIANNFNKELIDENDIYILKKDYTYAKPDDKTLDSSTIASGLGFEPGVLKINFETRQDSEGNYYNPITLGEKLYLQSYTSKAGFASIDNTVEKKDMYRYMSDKDDTLKKAYYTALGREKQSSFKYTITDNFADDTE